MNAEAQQDDIAQLLRAYDAPARKSFTGYTYLVDAINALSS
jgi:hypothetical protein